MIKRLLFGCVLACLLANAAAQTVNPIQQNGSTILITGATSAPTPVQVSGTYGYAQQYVITNAGSVTAFVSFGATSSAATAGCVIPGSGTPQSSMPILPLSAFVITGIVNPYVCAITASSTAAIYVTPGVGQ